jgi:MerR family transcriptional regulator, thiopeptide resistance regulator
MERKIMAKNENLFSTGELAKMVGVSLRTLQYYDEQNLLKPSITEGGRRRYTREHVLRLEQILFLKSFGFSLEEIKDKILDLKTASDFNQVFLQQREVLTEQVENLNHTIKMLDTALSETKNGQEIDMDRLIMIMESMKRGNPYTFIVRYLDDDQLKNYAVRLLGTPDNTDYVKDIFNRLEELYRQDANPAGEDGQELAKRWWGMVNQFAGGDLKLIKSLMYMGNDIQNWPEETEQLKKPIQNFLAKAFTIYLDHNGIKISGIDK